MQLSKLQEKFKDLMLDHPDALNNPTADFSEVFSCGDIPLPERLKVYRNNIVGGLSDTIATTFPIVKKLVGDQFLEQMARNFILKNPPDVGCLNTYGRGFDDFIRGFEPAKSLPYLGDVAGFEIAMNESYYAPDEAALTAEDLATVSPEDLESLTLQTCSHVKLISSPYPLLAIKAFCDQENPEGELDLEQGGVKLMVLRPEIEVQIAALDNDEFEALSALQSGKMLGKAVETVLDTYTAFDFQAFLQKNLALETFKALGTNKV